jgi:hypothetical protein
MEMIVQRNVPLSVQRNAIEQPENVRIVPMVNGVVNARTTVEKAVTTQAWIVKHVTQRQVNVSAKWDTTVQAVIRNVEEDVTQLNPIA